MRRLGRVDAVLAALLLLVVAALVAVLLAGARVLPWTTRAERSADTLADVRAAAERAVLAFLDVDYRDMDSRIDRLESLTTGTFKKQYAATSVDLKAAAQQAKAVSSGAVRHLGVSSVDGHTATVLVAADNVVRNTSTKDQKETETCPHAGARCDQYRFVVTLTRTSAGWRLSNLEGAS